MPILFALFGVLRIDAVTQAYKYMPEIPVKEAFLWLSLDKPDPFFILPVLNGIVSFVQQKLTGSGDNPQMKQMMYMFPIMMIFISYKMPAGLQVYWVVSSLAGIVQQYWIMNRGAKKN
jgi:YidC/Oxa1 family membrane protein insertase